MYQEAGYPNPNTVESSPPLFWPFLAFQGGGSIVLYVCDSSTLQAALNTLQTESILTHAWKNLCLGKDVFPNADVMMGMMNG